MMPFAIPDGVCGDWRVKRWIETSGLTVLDCKGVLFMSDEPGEIASQQSAIDECRRRGGDVLVTGLGLGLFVQAISDAVRSVTVIEASQEVVDLVLPSLRAACPCEVRVIVADARMFAPDRHYSVVWHDIWPRPNLEENRRDRAVMEPMYAPWCDWQGFWECN